MRRITTFFILSLMCLWAKGDDGLLTTEYNIQSIRYWFDITGQPSTSIYNGKSIFFDASALTDGMHTLFYQLLTDKGEVAPTVASTFMKISDSNFGGILADKATIAKVQYWYDIHGEVHSAAYTSNSFTLDASALTDGMHTLYYQLITDKGEVSEVTASTFMKVSENNFGGILTDKATIAKVQYWYDIHGEVRSAAYTSNGFTLDASALTDGMHTLYYQLITDKGDVSEVTASTFMKVSENNFGGILADTYSIKSVRYWFDRLGEIKTASYTGKNFTLDASALTDGVHTLYYQMVDANGHTSDANACTFMKVTTYGDIAKINEEYTPQTIHYWLDGNEAEAHTIPYTTAMVPLDLSAVEEGEHILYYQVYADNKKVSPVEMLSFERSLFDISINKTQTFKEGNYSDSLMAQRPFMVLNNRATDASVLGHLTVEDGDTLSLGKFTQRLHYGTSTANDKYTASGETYYHISTLVNDGMLRSDSVNIESSYYRNKWYFISLPFNVNIANIKAEDGVQWVVRRYDGAERAAGHVSNTWQNLAFTDKMEAGQGYIIQATRSDGKNMCKFTFPAINDTKKNGIFANTDQSVTLEEHLAEFNHNRSWNFIANPYSAFYDSRHMNFSAPITVWNGTGYDAYSLEDDAYILMPFEGFFVQKPLVGDAITFCKEGHQHSATATTSSEAKAWRSPLLANVSATAERRLYNFYISDGENEDHCRIVLNDNATQSYEMERDACKFMNQVAALPMIYTSEGNVAYSINERPKADGIVPLTLYGGEGTTVTLRYEAGKNAEGNVLLVDSYTGDSFNLCDNDVELNLAAGTTAGRYYISFVDLPSAIEAIQKDNSKSDKPSMLYDIQGRAVSKPIKNNIYIQDGKKFFEK